MIDNLSEEFLTPTTSTYSECVETETDETEKREKIEELMLLAETEVTKATNLASMLIKEDIREEFFYKNPQLEKAKAERYPAFLAFEMEYQEKFVDWVSIQQFSFNEIFSQIQEYISMWILSPFTLFTLIVHDKTQIIPLKGTRYFIDALFSKPTRRCPNPLPVAKTYFTVTVPERLPKHYPVMVTYRFEGYRTIFYALGKNAVRSKDFQRFYIDSILHRKLAFYTRIFECRHPKKNVEESDVDAEGEEKGEEDGDLSSRNEGVLPNI